MKKAFLLLLLTLCLTAFYTSNCKAHHGGETVINGPGIAGPIITIPARTLSKNQFLVSTGINYTHANEFSNLELINLGKRGEHFHDTQHFFTPSLSAGYGITDNLFIGVTVPYVFKYDIRANAGSKIFEQGNSIGVGDITFLSIYRFIHNQHNDFNAALISGITIPSGVRKVKDDQGFLFEADDQPGTGSWNPLVGLAISKSFKHLSLDVNGLYKFSTEGTQNTTVGDVANFNAAISRRIKTKYLKKIFVDKVLNNKLKWDVILETNGIWSEKPEFKFNLFDHHINVRDENHGGLVVFITPGLRLNMNDSWVSNLAVSLPIIDALNGRQKAPSIRLLFSLTKVF